MKYIENINECVGKEIKQAALIEYDEIMVFIFTDGTCACINIDFCGDSHSLDLTHYIDNKQKRDAGIISQEEYDVIENTKAIQIAEIQKRAELLMLDKLKKKYEQTN